MGKKKEVPGLEIGDQFLPALEAQSAAIANGAAAARRELSRARVKDKHALKRLVRQRLSTGPVVNAIVEILVDEMVG